MATKIEFDTAINSSLQAGDSVYYTTSIADNITSKPLLVGKVKEVGVNGDPNVMTIWEDFNWPGWPLEANELYFLFEKPIQANESSLKGYYADVTFSNKSTKQVELFAVSSEIAFSSK